MRNYIRTYPDLRACEIALPEAVTGPAKWRWMGERGLAPEYCIRARLPG
jgi:hypothetical protein